uniref:Uncharacterized protein n=1 Tax=Hucho hucho TaxID=62062 RepID=A0A4W5PMW5_9TELE
EGCTHFTPGSSYSRYLGTQTPPSWIGTAATVLSCPGASLPLVSKPIKHFQNSTCVLSLVQPIGFYKQSERLECVCTHCRDETNVRGRA